LVTSTSNNSDEDNLENAPTDVSASKLSVSSNSTCSEEEEAIDSVDSPVDLFKTGTLRIKSDQQINQGIQSSLSNKKSDLPSSSSEESQCQALGKSYQDMATIKRPKKVFASDKDRDQFVRQYKAKLKTEMCRNWEISGTCFFKDTCSFAHGAHELVKKKHVPPNFKTKACVQFHETGFCPYGNRC
jgi:uncharacterized protein (DUF885 family)